MTYEYYITLIGEYINAERSFERFCAEIGYPENAPSEENFIKAISIIAASADGNMKKLIELSALKMSAFSRKFMIPYRSLQNWCDNSQNSRKPPEYLPILIGYILVSEVWSVGNGNI